MLHYWLWLATRKHLGVKGQLAVLTHFGSPEAAYFADPEEYRQISSLNEKECKTLEDKRLDEAESILRDCYEKDIKILTWQDA